MALVSGGKALVSALETHHVDTVFGIPGTHNLAAFAALSDSRIRVVLTRHEQGAGYAADGYARVAGRPGVCLTTTGPAILNAMAAAAQSWSDSVPVLFVSPGMPLRHPGLGNGTLHEVKDQHQAMQSVVAYSHRVTSIEEIPHAVALAFAAMQTGRPRPVHLEIPLDLLDETAEAPLVVPVSPSLVTPEDHAVAAADALLSRSSRPVVVAGGGALRAAELVQSLAERLQAPVLTTVGGKGILDESHPLSVGAGLHHDAARALLADADVVVAVGTEFAPSDLWDLPLAIDDKLVRIDVDPASIVTNADPAVRIVADASAALHALLQSTDRREPSSRASNARADLATEAADTGAPWRDLVEALNTVVDHDTVVAGDSTMACYYGALTMLRVHRPAGFLYPAGGGTLGYGLPAAIGAALSPEQPKVLALMGDGGLMFTLPELATAAALRLPLPVVVVDNGGYGEIRNEMADRGDPIDAVRLGGVDFTAAATALGCHAHEVTSVDHLPTLIEDAWSADRPTLLHVREESRASREGGT